MYWYEYSNLYHVQFVHPMSMYVWSAYVELWALCHCNRSLVITLDQCQQIFLEQVEFTIHVP